MQISILFPCIAMVVITAVVWVRLYVERIGEIRQRQIKVQDLATTQIATTLLDKQNAANNFKNLFEVPLLFIMWAICTAQLLMRA